MPHGSPNFVWQCIQVALEFFPGDKIAQTVENLVAFFGHKPAFLDVNDFKLSRLKADGVVWAKGIVHAIAVEIYFRRRNNGRTIPKKFFNFSINKND